MTEEKKPNGAQPAMEPATALNGYYAPSDIIPILEAVLELKDINPRHGQVILDCMKWAITEKGWQASQAWRMELALRQGTEETKTIAEQENKPDG